MDCLNDILLWSPLTVHPFHLYVIVFRVDLICSGKVDGEAVLTVQLNLTTHTSNYMVLNFKRRKMCYKSKYSNDQKHSFIYLPLFLPL